MRFKLAAVTLGIVVVASAFGASTFTTATVSQSTSMDVVSDDRGLVGLAPGNASTDLVRTGTDGKLTIDFSDSAAAGFNGDSTFQIGDNTSTPPTYAFNITNNDGAAHTFDLSYAFDGTNPAGENVKLSVYNASGSHLATASDEASATFDAGAGTTRYVVVTVDTSGLDNSSTLSGTVQINA
ncbi:MAG: hypothetical protein ABEJ80_03215 [Halarchaeum sp.]